MSARLTSLHADIARLLVNFSITEGISQSRNPGCAAILANCPEPISEMDAAT